MPSSLVAVTSMVWLVAVSASVVPADAAAQDSPALDRIIETSTLRVGMSGSQPPFNMKARDGAPMGLEVDLANALAAAMKVELQIVEMPFADLIPALENGDVDLVMSGMTITADRSRRVSFVGPYAISGKSILTTSAALARIDDADDIDQSKVRMAALKGSTSEEFARSSLPNVELILELTGDKQVLTDLYNEIHHGVRIIDHVSARVFWDLIRLEQSLREELQTRANLEKRFRQFIDSANDLIAIKYLETLESIADGKATKIFLPFEASGVLGSVAGIGELLKEKVIPESTDK